MDKLKPKDNLGRFKARHGMYGTKLYHIWNGFTGRCLNKNNKDYQDYGGRGITVCDEWKIPEMFFGWAFLNGYNVNLSLDRIDTNKGYSPDNCRWVTMSEQQRNKRNNKFIEYNGEIHCISEWAELTGIPKGTITSRLRYGWTPEEIFTIKPSYSNSWLRRSRSVEQEREL